MNFGGDEMGWWRRMGRRRSEAGVQSELDMVLSTGSLGVEFGKELWARVWTLGVHLQVQARVPVTPALPAY